MIVLVPQPVIFVLVAMSNVSIGVPLFLLMTSVPVPRSTTRVQVMVRFALMDTEDAPSVGENNAHVGTTADAGEG